MSDKKIIDFVKKAEALKNKGNTPRNEKYSGIKKLLANAASMTGDVPFPNDKARLIEQQCQEVVDKVFAWGKEGAEVRHNYVRNTLGLDPDTAKVSDVMRAMGVEVDSGKLAEATSLEKLVVDSLKAFHTGTETTAEYFNIYTLMVLQHGEEDTNTRINAMLTAGQCRVLSEAGELDPREEMQLIIAIASKLL